MILDHTYPSYVRKMQALTNGNKYNGAYYYSKEIVKNIIPYVQTNRNWVTVRIPEINDIPDHSIIFIHNNCNPNYYEYLKDLKDCILVCGLPSTRDNVSFFGKAIYLPLSVDVKQVEKYKVKNKTKDCAFAGRRSKINFCGNRLPKDCDIITDMPQSQLLREMAKYKKIYATGRVAIQAKILGCELGLADRRFNSTDIWKVLDNRDAAKMLQQMINEIDGEKL